MDNLKTAIMCIAKMENTYIRDFVEYYHRLGFTHIFIYDNNDVDGEQFTDVIADYIHDGYVTIVNVRGIPGEIMIDGHTFQLQANIYTHCYHHYCKEYDWVMAVDIDEFLTFADENITINDFLSQSCFNDTDMIYVNWKCYGDSDKIYYEAGIPIYERLTQPIAFDNCTWKNAYSTIGFTQLHYDNQTVKSIVRTNKNIQYVNSHVPVNCGESDLVTKTAAGVNESVNPIESVTKSVDFSCAYLRHYITKTLQEWMENKMQRGYPDSNNKYYTLYPAAFFRHGNKWTIEKQEFIDKFMYENYVKKDGTKN